MIHVIGIIPAGDGPLTANYTVDNGQPISRTEPTLSQNSSLSNQVLFVSPILPMGQHNLSIEVVETGVDRNYTLQSFFAMSDGDGIAQSSNHNDKHGINTTAIAISVLSTAVLLLAMALGISYIRRRRRRVSRSREADSEKPPVHSDTDATGRKTRPSSRMTFDGAVQQHRMDGPLNRGSSVTFRSEVMAPEINPFILSLLEDVGVTTVNRNLKLPVEGTRPASRSANSESTSLPPYCSTLGAQSERSLQAQDAPSLARASYANSHKAIDIHNRSVEQDPFKDEKF